MIISRPSQPTGGAYRDRHGRGARGAVDVRVFSGRELADEDIFTDEAKSCGPDPPTLGSSLAGDPRGDGG